MLQQQPLRPLGEEKELELYDALTEPGRGQDAVFNILQREGIDVNYKLDIQDDKTLLMIALSDGHDMYAMIVRLLDSGADINAKDIYGKTPLIYACSHERISIECVQLLLERGAYIDAEDNYGKTPLMYACSNENISEECVQLLLDSGADIIVKDKYGKTPLIYACSNENISEECVRLLLERGAYIEAITNQKTKKTVLVDAYQMRRFDICELLIKYGARLTPVIKNFISNLTSFYFDISDDDIADILLLCTYKINYIDTLPRKTSRTNQLYNLLHLFTFQTPIFR